MMMRAVCSWCGELVREGREPVTHTICTSCAEEMEEELEEEDGDTPPGDSPVGLRP